MMRAPAFWRSDGVLARTLAPLSWPVAAITARRLARPGWRVPVPVLCVGNATMGGAGKTTVALDLTHRLSARGVVVHVLLRGYRGAARGPHRVWPGDPVALTGDEALLLAELAPTWVGADRAASAREAVAAGAQVLLLDDGLQNPTLAKTMALLVVDGATGFGNGRVFPAGPLREPIASAAARCAAAVIIGPDTAGATGLLPPGLPVLHADLAQDEAVAALRGRRVLAFAGIAIPEKFFAALERCGVELAGRMAFPDHHPFTARDLDRLHAEARRLDAVLATTPKDKTRLPSHFDVSVVGVRLVWHDPAAIEAQLDRLLLPSPGAVASMA